MAKLESSLRNMMLSLVTISIVAAGALACVYMLTNERIEAQKLAKQEAAKLAVLNGQEGESIEVAVDGFGGKFRVMVGLDAEGNILGYEILEHQETPGLGAHMDHWFKDAAKPGQNIIGRKAGELTVSKDGGDVDAITAATITSRAFLKAINEAYAQQQGTEAKTGASQLQKEEPAAEEAENPVEEAIEQAVETIVETEVAL